MDRFLASNRVHTSGVPRTCEGYRSRSKKLMASPTLDPHAKLLQALCRKAGLTHTNTHDHSTIQDDTGRSHFHSSAPAKSPDASTLTICRRLGPKGAAAGDFGELGCSSMDGQGKMNGSSNGLSLGESCQTCSKSQLGSLSIFLESGMAKKI